MEVSLSLATKCHMEFSDGWKIDISQSMLPEIDVDVLFTEAGHSVLVLLSRLLDAVKVQI